MKHLVWVIAVTILAAMAPAAGAQDDRDDDQEVRGTRIVIELDTDGRIVVNGSRLSESEGPLVLHVRPDGGEVEVEAVSPRDRAFMRGRLPGTPDGKEWFAHFSSDFELPDIKIEPLIRDFRFEPGEGFGFRFEEHAEVAELERESREIAREARRAEGAERERLETRLREKLDEIFDRKMELRRERIERLQEELDENREQLEQRADAREEMIERRLRRLMGEGDVLEW